MTTTMNTAAASLSDEQIDVIANAGCRNAAGGIYATRVHDFARAIEAEVRASLDTLSPRADAALDDEGCTPADAKMLRAANHSLADENDRLRRALRPFAALVSTDRLSWAMVEYCVEDDPEKQTFQRPQMQRAFNRAAELLRESVPAGEQIDSGSLDLPDWVKNAKPPTPQADAAPLTDETILAIENQVAYLAKSRDDLTIKTVRECIDAAIAAGGAQETAAARDALAERQRQVAVEGFAPEQDDRYQDGSLAGAAICYALTVFGAEEIPNYYWPRTWSASWWKPTTPRRNLVKAAALILAEIERIDRAAPGTCFFCSEPMNSAHESDCPQAPTAASNGAPK